MTPNEISNRLFKTSNIKSGSQTKIEARRIYANELSTCNESTAFVNYFSKNDIEYTLKAVRNGKRAGADGIYLKLIKNIGPKGKTWLAKLSSDVATRVLFLN